MSLKENLIQLMKKNYVSIKDLSLATEISEATLKRLRTIKCNPTLDVLIRLSQALKTPINSLIKDNNTQVFNQDDEIILTDNNDELFLNFTRNTFEIKNGTKALFKKYSIGEKITKYIVYKNKTIMEKIDADKMLFKDENQKLFSINSSDITHVIVKLLYEVEYV